MSYLFEYEEINGGYVAFGGDPKGDKITGKGKINKSKLDFKDVYFVKELKFNLFSVLQMCDKKKSVLFTDTECVVLSPDFKLNDESHVLLKVPRKDNIYSVDLKNVVPQGDLTCLFTKLVVARNQSNGSAGKARVDTVPDKDYILLPLWTQDALFSSSSKDSPGDGFKPSGVEEKNDVKDPGNEDNEVLSIEEPRVNQKKDANVNSTNNINIVSTTANATSTKDNAINENIVYRCADDPNMPNLEEIIYSDDDEDVGAEAMDVKSAFPYGKIKEEVYVCQPLGFEDPEFPDRVYKVKKALYSLHQALIAWYETLSTYLLDNVFQRGQIDKTLFIKRVKGDILLVQLYVDDIIFGSTRKDICTEFKKMMHKKFQMSSIRELTFFLGLQVIHKDDRIFISEDTYVNEILKKFGFSIVKTVTTPMETSKPLMKDENANDVNVHLYRSMISSLMCLTSPRPDIKFSDLPFNLEAYTDSEYAGASLDRKSTTGGCQFLRSRLISWQCKKQTIVANSTSEAKYVAASNCYEQVLWFQNQMLDYGYNFTNTKIFIDNESTICIFKNPVFHSKTKKIKIRHHFIRDLYEKRLIYMTKIYTDHNVVDLLTKAFDVSRFHYLIANETVHEDKGERVERAATTAASLNAEQDSEESQEVRKEKKVKNFITQKEERYGHDIEINTASTSITTASINITIVEPVTNFSTPITVAGVSVSTAEPKVQRDFDKTMSWINLFVPMNKEVVEGSGKKAKSTRKEAVSKKRARKGLNEKSVKRQKLEDDAEKEELSACLEIIIRSKRSMKYYKIFSAMLDDFDRQDVLDIYRLAKERFETTSPEGYDRLLWGDLKTLFETSKEDEIWKNQ
nr:uncharacterized mitochondrial protein AtMg00810-like [Tanacetum cinerariifolium]